MDQNIIGLALKTRGYPDPVTVPGCHGNQVKFKISISKKFLILPPSKNSLQSKFLHLQLSYVYIYNVYRLFNSWKPIVFHRDPMEENSLFRHNVKNMSIVLTSPAAPIIYSLDSRLYATDGKNFRLKYSATLHIYSKYNDRKTITDQLNMIQTLLPIISHISTLHSLGKQHKTACMAKSLTSGSFRWGQKLSWYTPILDLYATINSTIRHEISCKDIPKLLLPYFIFLHINI